MTSHTGSGLTSLSAAVDFFHRECAAGTTFATAIQPALAEIRRIQVQVDICRRISDHARLFWNQVAAPPVEGASDPSPDLNEVSEFFEDLVSAATSDLAETQAFIERLSDRRANTEPRLAEPLSECKARYAELADAWEEMISFFRENLPKANANDEVVLRFYPLLWSQVDAVQSGCSALQEALTSLARAVTEILREDSGGV